ncbi:MAG TPA: permease prefix domain 1-containing protein [Gemmataceae bacterium]|nr:permease prefix domain 1-containing protein [Gemmataceae bacterium]
MDKLDRYLDQVCRGIAGPRSLRQHIRQELREHLLDAAAEHRGAGLSEEDALARALADFGGPEQVGSELAATHGHRLTAVMIDKAIEWKEKTMKAKWLWSSWALLVVVGLLALEIFTILFGVTYLIPKYQKFARNGWLGNDASSTSAFISWAQSFQNHLADTCRHTTWLFLGFVGLWGLFEWRVRSENKSMMRLASLGSGAFGLMVVIVLMSAALTIPLILAIPNIATPPPEQMLLVLNHRVTTIDRRIDDLEEAVVQKNWNAARELTHHIFLEIDLLHCNALAVFQEQLATAENHLQNAKEAILKQDTKRLQDELQHFRKAYAPVHDAVMKAGKVAAPGK